jgi:hypothetical protein
METKLIYLFFFMLFLLKENLFIFFLVEMYCPEKSPSYIIRCQQVDWSQNEAYGIPTYTFRSPNQRNCAQPQDKSIIQMETFLRGYGSSASTTASGFCTLLVNPTMSRIAVNIFVNELSNITSAHLHLRPTTSTASAISQNAGLRTGTIVLPLLELPIPMATQTPFSGYLMNQEFNPASFTGILQGKSLSDFVFLVRQGRIYLTIHTTSFPSGQLFGYLRITRTCF